MVKCLLLDWIKVGPVCRHTHTHTDQVRRHLLDLGDEVGEELGHVLLFTRV